MGRPALLGLALLGVILPLALAFNAHRSVGHSKARQGHRAATPQSTPHAARRPSGETIAGAVPRASAGALAGTASAAMPGPPTAKGPLLMIDPGHGGSNNGAFGEVIGRYEKELCLSLARRLRDAVRRLHPRIRVQLTRTHDYYLTLAQRVRLANAAGANAFISLHFNASPDRLQRGFETFVLSADATDREALGRAALENHDPDAQQRATVTASPHAALPSQEAQGAGLRALLADLSQRQQHLRSHRLATELQSALATARPGAPNRGVRQAPFDVLLGLKMPGVLVELGFLDHLLEGIELAGAPAQRLIADSLAEAIGRFFATTAPGTHAAKAQVASARTRRRATGLRKQR